MGIVPGMPHFLLLVVWRLLGGGLLIILEYRKETKNPAQGQKVVKARRLLIVLRRLKSKRLSLGMLAPVDMLD